jgi:hypothetical protein
LSHLPPRNGWRWKLNCVLIWVSEQTASSLHLYLWGLFSSWLFWTSNSQFF